jgi:hypothetical protein
MIAADSRRVLGRSGVLIRWRFACPRACRARAFAPHVARPSAQRSGVQTAGLERDRPAAVVAFAGLRARALATQPGRCGKARRSGVVVPEEAKGKIEGGGTVVRASAVCTWGSGGTRPEGTACRPPPESRTGYAPAACRLRPSTPRWAGASS